MPWAGADEVDELLSHADGVFLTGSPSNVHPSHFGEDVHDPALPLDPARDEWTLPLTRKALAQGVPMLAICRGFQETNVALGGTLHQAVQEQPGKHDHRAPSGAPADVQYGLAHDIDVQPGGLLGFHPRRHGAGQLPVHGQGIKDPPRVRASRPSRRTDSWRPFRCRPPRGLQPVRAMAPRVARRGQPGVDEAAARVRRRLPELSQAAQRPAGARPGLLRASDTEPPRTYEPARGNQEPTGSRQRGQRANSASQTSNSGSTTGA